MPDLNFFLSDNFMDRESEDLVQEFLMFVDRREYQIFSGGNLFGNVLAPGKTAPVNNSHQGGFQAIGLNSLARIVRIITERGTVRDADCSVNHRASTYRQAASLKVN
jgi:hypothetical protein